MSKEKKYNWKCANCHDVVLYTIQPYCKKCCHIERQTITMELVISLK